MCNEESGIEKERWTHLLIRVAFKETPLDWKADLHISVVYNSARLSGDSNAAPSDIFPFSFWRTIAVWRLKTQTNSLFGVSFFFSSVFHFWMPFGEKKPVQTSRTCTACGKKKDSTPCFKSARIDAVNLYWSVLSLSLSLATCIWCLNSFF